MTTMQIVRPGEYRFPCPTPLHNPSRPPVHNPMKLSKIAWGKRDPKLAHAVMRNIERTMPPIVIPWQRNFGKIAALLRSHGFVPATGAELADLAAPRKPAKPKRKRSRKGRK